MKRHLESIALLLTLAVCVPVAANRLPAERNVWDDPTFRDQFLGSYGFNSDIEPPIRPEELDALNVVLGLMGNGDLAAAEQRLLEILEARAESTAARKLRESDKRRAARIAEQRAEWERRAKRYEILDPGPRTRESFEEAYAAWRAKIEQQDREARERQAREEQRKRDRAQRKQEHEQRQADLKQIKQDRRRERQESAGEPIDEADLKQAERAEKLAADEDLKERRARVKALESKADNSVEEGVFQEPSAVFNFMLGNVYFEQEDWDRAGEQFTLATARFPSYRRAFKNLGLVHVRRGDLDKAIEPLSEVIRLGGETGLVYGLLGYAYSSTEQWVPAESAYRNAMMLDPESVDWKLGLTQAVMRQQKYGETIALSNQLIANDPDNADYWMLQATAYIGSAQPMKAAQNYELLERMGKSTVNSLNTLGDIYVNEQMWDLAARAYGRAAEIDASGDASRLLRNVETLAMRGALDQARALVDGIVGNETIVLDEEQRVRLLKLESRIAVADGASEESLRVLEEIVELNPLDGEALILLGQHYAAADQPDRAIFYFERAQSLTDFEADASMRHAQVLVDQSRFKEAVPLLKRAQEIRPREDVGSYLEQIERAARAKR